VLSLDLKINGQPLGRIEIVRQESLGDPEFFYDYLVQVTDNSGHFLESFMTSHRYSEGAVVLVLRVLEVLREKGIVFRGP